MRFERMKEIVDFVLINDPDLAPLSILKQQRIKERLFRVLEQLNVESIPQNPKEKSEK